ncbi:hypothetical protein I4300191C4_03050 [Solibaculum mannosilyticum]
MQRVPLVLEPPVQPAPLVRRELQEPQVLQEQEPLDRPAPPVQPDRREPQELPVPLDLQVL